MQYIVVKKFIFFKYSYLRKHGIYRKHQKNGGFAGKGDSILFAAGGV